MLAALVHALYNVGELPPNTPAGVVCGVLAVLVHSCDSKVLATAVASVIEENFCASVPSYWTAFLGNEEIAALIPPAVQMVSGTVSVELELLPGVIIE